MISATQLIKYVIDNDYETIEKLIQSQKKLNWDCQDRKGYSILFRAVETRSKECFDLLMNSSLNLRISDAFNKATEYYLAAPNQVNEHYIMRLLEKTREISPYILVKFFDNSNMFNHMFSKINKNEQSIEIILIESIIKYKLTIFTQILNMLDETKPDYWIQTNLINKLFKCAVDYENIDVINLIKNKINWKEVNSIPSIYYALACSNFNSFNYFFGLIEELDKNEVNQIPNIKNLNLLFCSNFNLNNFNNKFKDFLNGLKKILKLELKFNQVNLIGSLFQILVNTYNNHYSIINLYFIAWWLIQNNLVKTNPCDEITNIISNFEGRDKFCKIRSFVENFDYILSDFNFHFDETIIKKYNLRKNPNYLTEKTNLIEILKKINDNQIIKKTNIKKTKKDIDL